MSGCGHPSGDALPVADELEAASALFAAMAHPARLLALVALGRRGPMSAGDLAAITGLEQSAMSHQLRALRRARLILDERRGRRVIYRLADHHVSHLVEDALAHAAE